MQLRVCPSFSGLGDDLIECTLYTHLLAFLQDQGGKSRHCPSLGNVAPPHCDGLAESPSPASTPCIISADPPPPPEVNRLGSEEEGWLWLQLKELSVTGSFWGGRELGGGG